MHLIYAFFKLTYCRKLKNVLGESFRFLDNSISAKNSFKFFKKKYLHFISFFIFLLI